jgi:hypothetical protein
VFGLKSEEYEHNKKIQKQKKEKDLIIKVKMIKGMRDHIHHLRVTGEYM